MWKVEVREVGLKVGLALLALQVILGYVLLAALVTRFAVLFTAGGPAGNLRRGKDERERRFNQELC